jgi:hypothetical protein
VDGWRLRQGKRAVNVPVTVCYVDGFNLFHGLRDLGTPAYKWLCLRTLAQSYLKPGDVLQRVIYFTAIADWNPDKARRHRKYIAALEARGIEVVKSRFQRVDKHCRSYSRYCAFQEEKETDVALACRVLIDATTAVAEKQIIVTADTDQVPLFRHIREQCPKVHLFLAAPPGRLRRAYALRDLAHAYDEIHPQRLGACLLPRNVSDTSGKLVAVCPAKYLP